MYFKIIFTVERQYRKVIRYTTSVVPYIVNELNKTIALNAMTKNVIMNIGRVHVAWQNGDFQIGGDQVTLTNVYGTDAL